MTARHSDDDRQRDATSRPAPLPPHLAIRYAVFAQTLGRDAADAFARRATEPDSNDDTDLPPTS